METAPDETVIVPEGVPLIATSSPSPTMGAVASIHVCVVANGFIVPPGAAAFPTDVIALRARVALSGSFGGSGGS
jgi:hypothetical protein